MVDPIFRRDIEKPQSLEAAVDAFFILSREYSSIINGSTTYPGRSRSIEDCFEFCKEYFAVTLDDVARCILGQCAANKRSGIYCYEVRRFVFNRRFEYFENMISGISRYDYCWPYNSRIEHQENLEKYLAWFTEITGNDYAR